MRTYMQVQHVVPEKSGFNRTSTSHDICIIVKKFHYVDVSVSCITTIIYNDLFPAILCQQNCS